MCCLIVSMGLHFSGCIHLDLLCNVILYTGLPYKYVIIVINMLIK